MSHYLTKLDSILKNRLNELSEQIKGTYVDVGANHPIIYSNTYHLYRLGWSGLAIDPLPTHKKRFLKTRPKDIYAEYAIDSVKGQKQFIISP